MNAKLTRQLLYGVFLLFILGLFRRAGAAQPLHVAVAANFAPAMEIISREFETETGIPVQLIISSSGRLFAQIQNQAPFDLFFSADSERPEQLHKEGTCGNPVLYATGKMVLWSSKQELCAIQNWEDVVRSEEVQKVALANPASAPYGIVARQVLEHLENLSSIETKLVYGTNVGQAFQYAQSGAVQASFVALSLALSDEGKSGCFWEIKESESVRQSACVTTNSQNGEAADRLLQYAISNATASIRNKFGDL